MRDYEIYVPLELLHLRPAAGLTIKGDIGILRGEGGQTTARIYWRNKATGITAKAVWSNADAGSVGPVGI